MTDKRQKATKYTCLFHYKTFNIPRIYSSLEKHLSFAGARSQNNLNFTTWIDQEKYKIKQNYIYNPMTTGFIMETLIYVSVWNFCREVADVPPGETSLTARSKKKRLYSQANQTLDTLSFVLFK